MISSDLFERVDTVFLVVDDLEEATDWYQEHLGADPQWRTTHISVVAIDDHIPITLVRRASSGDDHPLFNFYTPDIDKAHNHMSDKGVEVSNIQRRGGVSTFDFRDMSGNLLNVYHYDKQDTTT